jgi:hypothetical protein
VDQTAQSGCQPYFYDTLECSAADMAPSFIGRGRRSAAIASRETSRPNNCESSPRVIGWKYAMAISTTADDFKRLHITIDCNGTIIAGTRIVLPAGPECLIVVELDGRPAERPTKVADFELKSLARHPSRGAKCSS